MITPSCSLPSRTARTLLVVCALVVAGLAIVTPSAASAPSVRIPAAVHTAGEPDFGPNVYVFDPSMSVDQIQSTVDAIAAQQVPNQFGTHRYALLFKPGTYGTADDPLNFQVGYYTDVAGLGQSPDDVVINGSIDVRNQCDANGSCTALNNFWRSLSNLTIDVTTPNAGCYAGEFWAVSQAAPMRRVDVHGATTLMDYCTNPSYASGGFIADSRFDTSIVSGSQQQFFVRNSSINGWSNGVWNQVFAGVTGAPAQCYPATSGCGPYTTVATVPASKEKPYLYVDGSDNWNVFEPAEQENSSGPTWTSTPTPGRSIPLSDFYLAKASDSVATINAQLVSGKNLLFTPGVYNDSRTIRVERDNTVVLGMGFATITARHGVIAMRVTAQAANVDIAGLIFDAGPTNSPVLLQIGGRSAASAPQARTTPSSTDAPSALQDVFFRVGGPHPGRATTSLIVNTSGTILDDIWAWRADHGIGVGWTQNTADTGVLVNGDHVTATGLFVEHYQKFQVVWNGSRGKDFFFQSEMPYDVPDQASWMSDANTDGYAAFLVADQAKHFTGYGMGVYSFFNQGVDIFADRALQVPTDADVHLHDLLTIFLDPTNGMGGIRNVVNDTGGSSTVANPSTPVTVVDYP